MINVLLVSALIRLLRKHRKAMMARLMSGSDMNMKKKCSHSRDMHTVLTYMMES